MLSVRYTLTAKTAEGNSKTSNDLNGGGLVEEVRRELRPLVEKGRNRAFRTGKGAPGHMNNDYNHLAISIGKS